MGRRERSALTRFREGGHAWWETAISDVQPGRIVIRGERIEHLIESMSYAGVVGLMVGNLRFSNAQARLLEAALIAGVDHGVRAPSIAAARMAATCGVPLNCAVATGINLLGDDHGGAGEECMELLYETATRSAADATSLESVATMLIAERLRSDERIPGFGHQLHKDEDPRRSPMLRLIDRAIAAGEIKGSFARAGVRPGGAAIRTVSVLVVTDSLDGVVTRAVDSGTTMDGGGGGGGGAGAGEGAGAMAFSPARARASRLARSEGGSTPNRADVSSVFRASSQASSPRYASASRR